MNVIRKRLSADVFKQIFLFVLNLLRKKGLVRGKTLGIDATTLEANAPMKSIVRKDGGDGWNDYLRKLAAAEGIEDPTDDDLRRLDRRRKGKKVSNEDWESPSDPDSRITKRKDGRTHLAYKAEHAVDLETEAIVAAELLAGDLLALAASVVQPQQLIQSAALLLVLPFQHLEALVVTPLLFAMGPVRAFQFLDAPHQGVELLLE